MRTSTFDPTAPPFQPRKHLRFHDADDSTKLGRISFLEELPDAILIAVFDELDSLDLLTVSALSRRLRAVVIGFNIYDRVHLLCDRRGEFAKHGSSIVYKTVKPDFDLLTPPLQLLRLEAVDRNQRQRHFSIVQEASWSFKAMPILKADADKMVLATGNELWVSFGGQEWIINRLGKPGVGDISDIALTNETNEILVSFVDGKIERINIGSKLREQSYRILKRYRSESQNAVQAIDYLGHSDTTLSVYRHGQMVVNWSNIKIGSRPWRTKFVGSGKSIATGTRSQSPLLIHNLSPTGLALSRSYSVSDARSSVFAVDSISEFVVVSGWYDGRTHLHDLRSSSTAPVCSFKDPYEDAAVYSVAISDNRLYAGSARNGTVRMFDIRNTDPKSGISLFLGPRERGPVYSLVAEHERVFGALETSLRGLDFYRTKRHQSCRGDWLENASGAYYVSHSGQKMHHSLAT